MPEAYPALPVQRGMVLATLREPGRGRDVQQVTIDWPQPVDDGCFTATWRALTRRHAALRTSFRMDGDDGLTQVVAADAEPDLRRVRGPIDLAGFLRADRAEPFDVARAPLLRVTVFDDRVVVTFHHAVLDGRSTRILLDELFTGYSARVAGQVPRAPRRRPFADYVRWWGSVDLGAAETFWRGYLAGAAPAGPLPGELGHPDGPGPAPAAAELALSRADSDRVRALGTAVGAGASTMVHAAWALLRAAYGGTGDATFAVARSCRYGSVADADGILGVLINTVPFRVRPDPGWTVRQLLAEVAARMLDVRVHQLAPLTSILDWAGLAPDTALLDSIVIVERQRLHSALTVLGPEPARASVRVHRAPGYPLTLYAFDEPELRLAVFWDSGAVLDASVRRILAQVRDTLVELAGRPDARLADLRLGAAAEAPLRAAWNATARPPDATIPAVFAGWVVKAPDATAVDLGDGDVISYAALDRDTDRLAWALHRWGIGVDEPVGVALPRGGALVRALLAILKAGGAYLPVELASPPARVAATLATGGVRLVLTAAGIAAPDLPGVTVLDIDGPDLAAPDLAAPAPPGPPPVRVHPQNLAYISFTSGSTGVPKGVAIPHRAVTRLVAEPTFGSFGPGERILQYAPTAFDATTLEVWGALLAGSTVVVAPPDPLGLTDIAAQLRDRGISLVWLTAGLFHQLAELDPGALAGVGRILTGGDVVQPGAARAALAARAGRPLVNGYGPTENTVFTSCHVLTGPEQVTGRIPIGAPVQGTTVQVLDADGRVVPVGVVGELCTGGSGLARGYAGDAAGTARTFVPDPDGGGGRLYRTGDLARWRADGVLEFAGRVDHQVKIRGFRVEPGEVEAVLTAHPDVAEAVVVARGDGAERHLVGYVTPADGVDRAALDPAGLRRYLTGRLPEYLVPVAFGVLDRLPLNANGKVDRPALPRPDDGPHDPAAGPRTATERRLARLWLALLPGDRDGVGREVSFFALGGNSLTTARLMFRIQQEFDVDLGLGPFYRAPTLAATAAAVDAAVDAARTGPVVAATPALRRRDRSAHRVPAVPAAAAHLVPLTGDWALWRTVCLRTAGFPVDLLAPLGDPALAAAADAGSDDAYRAEFARAVGRLGAALHTVAGHPTFREAVAWQNRHALATGVDALLRHGPAPARRATKHRQHETLVASYLQRYCAKNDTIGFFGPVGWAEFDDGVGTRIRFADPPALVDARTVYLEGWAVAAVLAPHAARLRPWLVPRRMPFLSVDPDGPVLRLPLAPPVPLSDAAAAVLRACDGVRDARAVAAEVLDGNTAGLRSEVDVFAVLADLAGAHRIVWRPETAPHDTRPEQAARAVLARVTDDAVRGPALAALDELCAARDAVGAGRVAAAMAELESTFTRLSGVAPTRRAGRLYAGRTLVYEECRRADTVRFGAGTLDGIRAPLGLVLDSARWFTAAGAALFNRLFTDTYRRRAAELGTDVVPFSDFWLLVGQSVVTPPDRLTAALGRALYRRWAEVLTLPEAARRVRLAAADLAAGVAAAFPAGRPGWPTAVQHSPDLMIAGDEWVLGELHPGVNTMRYATWVAYHPDPDGLRAAHAADIGRPAGYPAETGQDDGVPTRQSNVFAGPADMRLVFAHDSFGYDPARSLPVGECDVVDSTTGLRVRRRDGRLDVDLMDVLGDLVATGLVQRFRLLAPAAHTPRVTIDSLVVSRESWTFDAAEVAFAGVADEADRYRRARAWAGAQGLPRHVFVRCTGERKPVYVDLTGLASIDLLARSVRRARGHGAGATVTVVEMLPTPDRLWLTDVADRRYAAELRIVAVDRRMG